MKAGAGKIIAVDLLPAKLELAKKWGATDLLYPKDLPEDRSVPAEFVGMTDFGVDYSFDCTGNTAVMRQALESSAAAGACRWSSAWPRPARRSPPGPSNWSASPIGSSRRL